MLSRSIMIILPPYPKYKGKLGLATLGNDAGIYRGRRAGTVGLGWL